MSTPAKNSAGEVVPKLFSQRGLAVEEELRTRPENYDTARRPLDNAKGAYKEARANRGK